MEKNRPILTIALAVAVLTLSAFSLISCEEEFAPEEFDAEDFAAETSPAEAAGLQAEQDGTRGVCYIKGWREEEAFMDCYSDCRNAGHPHLGCRSGCCDYVAGCPNCIFM